MSHYISSALHALSGVYTFYNPSDDETVRYGLTKEHLDKVQSILGGTIVQLHTDAPVQTDDTPQEQHEPKAWVLHIPAGTSALGTLQEDPHAEEWSKSLFLEMNERGHDGVDKEYFNKRKGKIEMKRSRWTYHVGDRDQEPDIPKSTYRMYSFDTLPYVAKVRQGFDTLARRTEIRSLENMMAEASVYYDNTCGIGYHGDDERPNTPVIGVNMGESRFLTFRSFFRHRFLGEEIRLQLNTGDMYFLSEEAVGVGWIRDSYRRVIFRHRAGSERFLTKHDVEMVKREKKKDVIAERKRKEQKVRAEKAMALKREAKEERMELTRKRKECHERSDKRHKILTQAAKVGASDHYFYEWLQLSDIPRHQKLYIVWTNDALKQAALDAENGQTIDATIREQHPHIQRYGQRGWDAAHEDFEDVVEEYHVKKQRVPDEIVTGDTVTLSPGDDFDDI